MNLDAFIERFNGLTEAYYFYQQQIELRYEPKEHIYYLVKDGELIPQDGVTTVVHIIDKSDALIPWGCKMMAAKLLANLPVMTTPTGDKLVQTKLEDLEKLILEAKNAHKEKLEEASTVGTSAHAWIEQYIKAVLASNQPRIEELLAKFPDDERAQKCCVAALDWMQRHNVRWICTERKIYSRKHQYAGTMDGLCLTDSCGDPLCCPKEFKNHLSLADWKTSNYLYLEYLFQTAAYQYAYEEEMGVTIDDRWVIRLGKDDAEFDPWHVDRKDYPLDWHGFFTALDLHRTVKGVKARIKDRGDAIKAEKKARERAAREEALKIKCKGADKYKGIRAPKCNKGNPCQTCLAKYQQVQIDKLSKSEAL